MENKANQQQQQKKQQQSQLNLSDLLAFAWRLRWWMAGGAVVALVLAFAYARMKTPVYQRQAWVMLNTNDGSNADMALLAEFTGRTQSKKIDNELFILQSPSMMKQVVKQYGLNTRYFTYVMPIADRLEWNWFAKKRVELYRNNPIELNFQIDSLYPKDMRPGSVMLRIENQKNEGFRIEELIVNRDEVEFDKKKLYRYGEKLPIAGADASISLIDAESMRETGDYLITWTTPMAAARGFVQGLSTEVIGQKMAINNIAKLYYNDAIPQRADDILNALVENTNQVGKDYKNIATLNTIAFIDQRIEALNQDLGTAEINYKQYQSSNTVVDLKSQSTAAITQDAQYKNQLTEVKLQQRVLEMIQDYIKQQPEGVYEVIPTNIGISDAGLTAILNTYNNAVAERNRMVAYSSETNPRVVSLNSQLEDGKKAIDLSIENLVRVYNIREKELERTLSDSRRQMANLPQQQFEVQQLSRQINIIEPLYLLLQQKREESQIAMYSQTDIFRLVEPAFGSPYPISGNKKIYLMALILGLCFVPGLVFLRMYLRTKVETKADLEGKVDATVMAVIPTVKDGQPKLIREIGRDVTSESFRMLRSNLQYLQGVKVIQVTSSTPGEGKSYVAANLAISIAHTGKRVILLGLDLRKPVLPQMFPDVRFDKNRSIVSYMIDGCSLDDIILHTDVQGLDIAMSGIIPPNPTELLSQGKEGEIIEKLRDQYDYIIIDSAPYLPVSDSFLINAFVDATLYVVRSGYTDLKMLPEINQAIHSEAKPMKRVSLVLNDLDLDDAKYRYGYGAGYGYGSGSGYGYGYGYGYGAGYDDSTTEKKRFGRKAK